MLYLPVNTKSKITWNNIDNLEAGNHINEKLFRLKCFHLPQKQQFSQKHVNVYKPFFIFLNPLYYKYQCSW